ncbi:MAG TPA: deoxynucleoside kinase [Acidobacteriota bacterium]|nr:deoxynucleoside kinase [Acidobacteriota bacterium]
MTYIAIEGPIGVGKTTLVQSFQAKLGAQVILDVFDNPFLADFYKDRPNAAFRTQMYFLISRFQQQVELESAPAAGALVVCDYLFAKDKIYAYLNLDDQEIQIYDRFFASLNRYAPTPDLVVYLKAPREVLLDRVRRRNVDFEAKISEAYVDELIKAYDHFFYHFQDTPLLIVDTAEIDFVENTEELRALMQRIAGGTTRGVQYYHPTRSKKK